MKIDKVLVVLAAFFGLFSLISPFVFYAVYGGNVPKYVAGIVLLSLFFFLESSLWAIQFKQNNS